MSKLPRVAPNIIQLFLVIIPANSSALVEVVVTLGDMWRAVGAAVGCMVGGGIGIVDIDGNTEGAVVGEVEDGKALVAAVGKLDGEAMCEIEGNIDGGNTDGAVAFVRVGNTPGRGVGGKVGDVDCGGVSCEGEFVGIVVGCKVREVGVTVGILEGRGVGLNVG